MWRGSSAQRASAPEFRTTAKKLRQPCSPCASGTDEHTRNTMHAPFLCRCQKLKCRCSLHATASPHASTVWPATCHQLSPNLPYALWTTFLWPRLQVAQVDAPRPTSQQRPRAVSSSQFASEKLFLARRRQRRPSTSAPWRRLSVPSAREMGAALEQRGTEPSAHRRMRDVSRHGKPTPHLEDSRRCRLAS